MKEHEQASKHSFSPYAFGLHILGGGITALLLPATISLIFLLVLILALVLSFTKAKTPVGFWPGHAFLFSFQVLFYDFALPFFKGVPFREILSVN